MNDNCFRKCAYKNICNLDNANTVACKVWNDKSAQETRETTTCGIKTEELLKMQYKQGR